MDAYWRGLWETEANENLDADWIKEVEESMGAKVSEEEIARRVEVSTDEVRQAIGKKRIGVRQGGTKLGTSGGRNL